MRPLELRLRGFRSYSEEQHFDFRGRNLIAIVGANGAGKSTILDAIAFALYGRTPRLGSKAAHLIKESILEAMVSLRFEAGGSEWEAVRILRRNGNQHALYRYDNNSSEPADSWLLEREVNPKVEELLGLDFRAFNRSVLLAQGKFDEFLGAGDADKNKVLKGLFGFERLDVMKQLALGRAKDAEYSIIDLGRRLNIAKQSQTKCKELGEQIQEAKARQEQLQGSLPEFEELDETLARFRQLISTDRKQQDAIEKLKLPDHKKSEKKVSDAEQAAAIIEKAIQVAADANDNIQSPKFEERSENCQNAERLVGGLRGLQATAEKAERRSTDALDEMKNAVSQLEHLRGNLELVKEKFSKAQERSDKTKQDLQSTEEVLLNARHQHMAAELRSSLEQGGDCPVCEQPVHGIPSAIIDTGVPQAEEEVTKAKAVNEEAESALRGADSAHKVAEERLETAVVNLKTLQAVAKVMDNEKTEAQEALQQCLTDLDNLLGEGDPVVRLREEKSALHKLQEQAKLARAAEAEARSSGKRAQQEMGELWDDLLGLAARLDKDISGTGDDPSAVREALSNIRQERDWIVAELTAKLDKNQTELDDTEKRRAELDIKYEIEKSVKEDLAAIRATLKGLSENLEAEKKKAADLENLKTQIQTEQSRLKNYQRLDKDLTDRKGTFVNFMLASKRMDLSRIGSEYFQRLSSDRYRFSEDGKFDVIDCSLADATRGSNSLSGGETFLASLALAVALAEMVGREGGRLDAFMLDEGFGSLDPEHLDLAMEGVEKLVSDSDRRLVLLVSHIREVRERVDDLLILEKDQITRNTKVVQGAGAA